MEDVKNFHKLKESSYQFKNFLFREKICYHVNHVACHFYLINNLQYKVVIIMNEQTESNNIDILNDLENSQQMDRLLKKKRISNAKNTRVIPKSEIIIEAGFTIHILLMYILVLAILLLSFIVANTFYNLVQIIALSDPRVGIVFYSVGLAVIGFLLYKLFLSLRNYFIFSIKVSRYIVYIKTIDNIEFPLEFLLDEIDSVSMYQGIIGKLFGYGAITIQIKDKRYTYRRINKIKKFYDYMIVLQKNAVKDFNLNTKDPFQIKKFSQSVNSQ